MRVRRSRLLVQHPAALVWFMVFMLASLMLSCSGSAGDALGALETVAEPTATPTAPPPTATPTTTPTSTPTATPTPVPTSTATATPTPEPTPTPVGVLAEAPWAPFEPVTFVELSIEEWALPVDLASYEAPDSSRWTPVYHEQADGERVRYPLRSPTYFGNALVLPVIEGSPGDEFIRVLSPVRPVGSNVWVRSTDQLMWGQTRSSIHVVLEENVLEVYDDCTLQSSAAVQLGSADTPTPAGFAWVDEILPGREGWGEWIFSIAIFSESLATEENDGVEGLAKLAIIGDAHLYSSGQSRGVIRMQNADLSVLHGAAPVGTPISLWATRHEFASAVGNLAQPGC